MNFPSKRQRQNGSTRFNRTQQFEDYQTVDLGLIFQLLCDANHYTIPADVRNRLVLGFKWLYDHFGNGRMARNTFEDTIHCLANRFAEITPLTKKSLTRIESGDVHLPDVSAVVWETLCNEVRFVAECPKCEASARMLPAFLCRKVRWNKCQERFQVDWAKTVVQWQVQNCFRKRVDSTTRITGDLTQDLPSIPCR